MDGRAESSETVRNKCAACFRQYNKKEHLVEHMRVSFHSPHEPTCGICLKHCRSFESLREHLVGPLPKVECAKVFSNHGCNFCLNIFESQQALRIHRESCQVTRAYPVINYPFSATSRPSVHNFLDINSRMQSSRAVALSCKMVGGGSDGSLDICARVCLIDQEENIIFHTYVRPQIPITNYRLRLGRFFYCFLKLKSCFGKQLESRPKRSLNRYEKTGISPEYLRDAMPLKQVQRKIHDFLCNEEPIWKVRSKGTRARILVGHGLDHDLESLEIEFPQFLIRDLAKYPPMMKTSKLSNSLKYLTQAYLGYEIQTGIQDPYEDCVAAMRLYVRLKAQPHSGDYASGSGEVQNRNNFPALRQRELENMSPAELLEISASDYYCWCLDAQRV